MSGLPGRRRVLAAGGALTAALPARRAAAVPVGGGAVAGGFVGVEHARGHLLRDGGPRGARPAQEHRCAVLVVGGGVAGLAAARALRAAGVDDLTVIELEDAPGGNSRSGHIGGFPCPRGAHYVPVPGPPAAEVLEFLAEVGARLPSGEWDERMLVHAPQERLLMHGVWQEGLLPRIALPPGTLDAYRRFAERVEAGRRSGRYAIPVDLARVDAALDAVPFASWLAAQDLRAPALLAYLDYCCRDDFGAGIHAVSAWAGLHYFASRHGLSVDGGPGGEAILTWPQGNGWLIEQLVARAGARIAQGVVVTRVEPGDGGVRVDALRAADGQRLRWHAEQVVLAVPAFIAARLLLLPGDAAARLARAAGRIEHSPWVVANLLVDAGVAQAPGAARAWDNVIHGAASLGYVDARHQRIDRRRGGPEVWTWYHAPGPLGGSWPRARQALLASRWDDWVARVVADLLPAHRDIARRLRRVEVVRYGHAMAVPAPGLYGSGALAVLREPIGRVHLAHADLAGYSVFEEAFTIGTRVGRRLAAILAGSPRA